MTLPSSQAARYARWKRLAFFLDLALTLGILWAFLVTGLASHWGQWMAGWLPGWPLQVAAYMGLLGVGLAVISFPLDWARGFFLERRFGLTPLAFAGWLKEYFKHWVVGGIITLAAVEALAALLRFGPAPWWIGAALLWLAGSSFLTRVAPTWLIPLFYRQRPLNNTDLQQRLMALLERCQTQVRGIFEINLSRTTRKANACLCGLGSTRRVLISDTLLSTHPPEEVEVVLAHELGHHRFRHIGILLVMETFGAGAVFFGAECFLRKFHEAMGIVSLTDLAALPAIGLAWGTIQFLLMPAINGVSRHLEAQADRFALEKTGNPGAFISTMRRLSQQNLSEISPPKWVEWLLYDHPSTARRIAMAQQCKT